MLHIWAGTGLHFGSRAAVSLESELAMGALGAV
jgi:hypothetical protein